MALVREQVAVGPRPAGSPQLRRARGQAAADAARTAPSSPSRARAAAGPPEHRRGPSRPSPGDPDRGPLRHGVPAEGLRRRQRQRRRDRGRDRARPHAAAELPARPPRDPLRPLRRRGGPAGLPRRDFQFCALRGSRAYAAAHPGQIGDMILLDYIANRGAQIPRETNSIPALWEQLREAARRGRRPRTSSRPTTQTPVIDDHIPFLEQAVPSIDLIDCPTRTRTGAGHPRQARPAVPRRGRGDRRPAGPRPATAVVVVEAGARLAPELALVDQRDQPSPGGRWCSSPLSAYSASPIATATSIPTRSSRASGPIG